LPLKGHPEVRMERFRLAVGHQHGVKPGNIVGAIANEADIDSQYIGHIEIHDSYSTIDLPAGMPNETFAALKKTRVCQQRLAIERMDRKARTADTKRRAFATGSKAKRGIAKPAPAAVLKGKPATAKRAAKPNSAAKHAGKARAKPKPAARRQERKASH
jgi:ATP-dependent RNA helicase DeaD